MAAHERHAGGPTQLLHVDDDLYVMQRPGSDTQGGLVLVLNNRGSWNGVGAQTRWCDTRLVPVAWHGRDDTRVPAGQADR